MNLVLLLLLQLFTLPTIPETIEVPEERAVYLAEHYWDNTPLSDTLVSRNAEEFEPFMVDYLTLLPLLDEDRQAAALSPLFAVATPLLRRYLTEEASPVYAPEVYQRALLALVSDMPQVEVHFRYRKNCETCRELMERVDRSEIMRRSIRDQHLVMRIHQTAGDPRLLLFRPSGECLSDNISMDEIEAILLTFER